MKFQWEKKQHQAKFWKGESLGSIVCIDTETEMIQGPSHIPFLVTFQAYSGEGAVRFVKLADVYSFLQLHADSTLIFHNAPFDLAVLEKECGWDFHTQVTQGKIHDTSILYRLWHLADKGHTPFRWSLDHCVKQMLNLEVEKDEKVRTSFGEFRKGDRVSYEKIPEGAYKYAAIDTICTLLLYRRLMDLILPISGSQLLSHKIQLMGSIALDDIRRNGIGFDLEAQREFRKTLDKKIYNYSNILATWGWVKGQPGNKKRFEQVVEKLGIVDELPRSPKTGEVSSKAEDLEPYTDYQFIDAYIHHQELEKISSFASINSSRVHPKYDLLKNTGRTSCTKPNVQQLPRAAGIRELFIPKPGHCFMIIDYSTLELCTLAQTCYKMYGKSVMRDLINEGRDLHKYYASVLLGKKEEDVTKLERQYAKACYSKDTELLTENRGWATVEELYNTEEKIAQYDPHTKKLSFVTPISWTRQEDKELIQFTSEKMDCAVTPDHRMLGVTRTGYIVEQLAEDYSNNESMSSVHGGHLEYTPKYDDIDTRLAVMIQADGCIRDQTLSHFKVTFGFTKERKIKRCIDFLTHAMIDFRVNKYSSQTAITAWIPKNIPLNRDKEFTDWKDICPEAFISELWRWDGTTYKKHGKEYCTTNLHNAEVAQTILSVNGYKAVISTDLGKEGRKDVYRVRWYTGDGKKNITYCRLSGLEKELLDGRHTVYCPSVPSTWVLTRRGGKVTVQGNCNFGFPGGLGIAKFVQYARVSYGLDNIDENYAKEMKDAWLETFPEMKEYLKGREGQPSSTLTGRIRSNCSYCAGKNTPFQGLAADGAKIALYFLMKQKFSVSAFIHDEVIIEELVSENLTQRFDLASSTMVECMKQVCPDVKISVEGFISNKWYKDGPLLTDEKGRYLVYEGN